eukprot:15353414-Ditylum_brightwellii.AAC.1
MILAVHSDASYLSESKARSRAAGHFYLVKCNNEDYNSVVVLTLSTIIRHVVVSASEAKLTALFYNIREAVPLCITLEEMGHPQAPTPLITDNNTAHRTMTPKRSKAINMRFHWLRCREAQQQFHIKWKKRGSNKADYHSKHHPSKVHQQQQMHYIVNAAVVQNIKNIMRCMHEVLTSQ